MCDDTFSPSPFRSPGYGTPLGGKAPHLRMPKRRNSLGLTHYVDEGDRLMVHACAIDTCETCGRHVEATNAIGIDRRSAKVLGLVRLPERLPEQGYNSNTGRCDCDACHAD
jgi:hypothetical protein